MACLNCLEEKRKKAVRLSEKQRIFTQMVGLLINWAFQHGYELTFGETWRTKEQAEWYAAKGIGTLNSPHCDRLAVDFNLFIEGVYQTKTEAYEPLGKYWKSIGGKWGGDFKKRDGNHFQY